MVAYRIFPEIFELLKRHLQKQIEQSHIFLQIDSQLHFERRLTHTLIANNA